MQCCMCEAWRIEQSIASKNAFSAAIGTHRGQNSLHKSFFWCFETGLIFCKPKNGFLCEF